MVHPAGGGGGDSAGTRRARPRFSEGRGQRAQGIKKGGEGAEAGEVVARIAAAPRCRRADSNADLSAACADPDLSSRRCRCYVRLTRTLPCSATLAVEVEGSSKPCRRAKISARSR